MVVVEQSYNFLFYLFKEKVPHEYEIIKEIASKTNKIFGCAPINLYIYNLCYLL